MKGPYERLKYDLRRLWECPVCKRRERTDGGVTFRHCECGTKQVGGQPVVMRLIADGPQRLVPVIERVRTGSVEETPAPVAESAEPAEIPTPSVTEEAASNDAPIE